MKHWIFLALFLTTVWTQSPSAVTPSPHVKKFVAPAYPSRARTGRMQGETTSELHVRADGIVDSVNVTMAHPVFRDYVQAALKQWEFEPTSKPFDQKVTIRFWLEDCDDKAFPVGETRTQADLPQLVEVRTCIQSLVTNTN